MKLASLHYTLADWPRGGLGKIGETNISVFIKGVWSCCMCYKYDYLSYLFHIHLDHIPFILTETFVGG